MKMKTTKFLAVLAVLAFAFAAFAVATPAEQSDATTAAVTESKTITMVPLTGLAGTIETESDGNYGVAPGSDGTVTITVPSKGSATLTVFFNQNTDATFTEIDFVTSAGSTFHGKVILYIATDVSETSVTYFKTGNATFSFSAPGQTKGVSTKIADSNTPWFYAVNGKTQAITVPLGGVFNIPANVNYNSKVTGAQKDDSILNSVSVKVDAGTDNVLNFTNSDEGVLKVQGRDAGTYAKFNMSSGSISTVNNKLGAITEAKNTFSTSSARANNEVFYASTYSGTIAGAVYALGEISGMDLKTSAAINFNGKDVAGRYTYENKVYQVETDDAAFVLNGPTLTTITSGTLKLVSGEFVTSEAKSTVIATLHVGPNAQLKLGGNYSMSTGTIIIEGSVSSTATGTEYKIEGSNAAFAKIAPTANVSSDISITASNNLKRMDWTPSTYKLEGTLQQSETVSAATLAGNTIIPAGMTLTVTDILCLEDKNLIVEGTLVINTGAMVGSQDIGGGKIFVSTTGKIENNGAIGKNFPITVQHSLATETTGSVTLQGVSGISMSAKTISSSYYMAISGTAVKISSILPTIDTHSITTNNVKITGDLTVTSGITMLAANTYVTKDVTLTIGAGAILNDQTTDNVIIENKGTISILGTFYGSLSGQTNDAILVTETSPVYRLTGVQSADINGTAINTNGSVKGFTLTVDRVPYYTDDASYYSQRVYIEGTLTAGYSEGNSLLVSVAAGATPLFIADDASLVTTDKAKIKVATNNTLMVQGLLVSADDTFTTNANGTHFSVTESTNTFYYVSDFDYALTFIEQADGKTLTIKGYTGDYMANKDYLIVIDDVIEIPAGCSISGTTPVVVIDEEGVVTVNNLSTWDARTFADSGILGKLIVLNGGSCLPTTAKYQVMLSDSENNRMYSSLAIILAEAEDGDEITLVGDSLENDSIVIDKAVTLKIAKTLQVYNLYIGAGAKVELTSAGALDMDCDADDKVSSKLVVEGELNVTPGSFTMAKAGTYTGTITSSGKFTFTSAQFTDLTSVDNKVKLVGAYYTSSGNYVLTTLTKALDSGNSVTIASSYSSVEAVTVAKDKSLTINATDVNGKAVEVSFLSVDLSKGATVTANGFLTTIVTGICGESGATDVSVGVADFKGGFTNTSATDSKGVTTWTFKTSQAATAGTVDVIEGTLTGAHTFSAAAAKDGHSFIIDEGAVFYSTVDPVLTNYSKAVINGALTCSESAPIDLTIAVPTVISGTVYCRAFIATAAGMTSLILDGALGIEAASAVGNANSVFYFDGTIYCGEDDNTFTVNGAAVIGAGDLAGEILVVGKITIGAGAYAISYTDTSDIYKTTSLNETVLTINGLPYVYVYTTTNAPTVTKVINTDRYIDFDIEGYDMSKVHTASNWVDYNGVAVDGTKNISDYEAIYFTAKLATLTLKTSWANGLALYVDGARVMANELTLTVGAHTVSAQVNAGYACDNMKITFDGVPVTVAGLLLDLDDDGAILALSGDVYIPEPEPVTPEEKSEWTVTTILLCVLVILIAIMAVIVALRLNRN